MDGTDTGAGHEGSHGLPGHRQVDGDGVALLDAPRLEDVGDAAGLAEELAVADLGALRGLICFVDDSSLNEQKVRIV